MFHKNRNWKYGAIVLYWFGVLLSLSCNKDEAKDHQTAYEYQIPEKTDDDWDVASLMSVGMDETSIIHMMNAMNDRGDHGYHSLLIVKDNKLVFETYFQGRKFNLAQYTGETGFDRNDTHNLCSVTKSFTSALIGIAIDKRFIQSVDQRVFDFFPEYSDLFIDVPEKQDLTLEHLLTMQSGIEWDDEKRAYSDSRNDMHQLFKSRDPIRFILSKDIVATPGT